MNKTFFAASLLFVASASQASDFSLGLSNTSIAADYTSVRTGQGLEFTLGGLRNIDHGSLISGGMQVSQQVSPAVTVSVGGKLVGVFSNIKDVSALALGGQVDVGVPNIPNLYVGMNLWYAPTVTSSNGARNFQDMGLSLRYRIMNNAEVFAGYRYTRVDFDNHGEHRIHDGGLLGLKLVF